MGGDFNSVRKKEEQSGCSNPLFGAEGFNKFIDDMKLIDLPLQGKPFTCFGSKSKRSRLDRFLLDEAWFLTTHDLVQTGLNRSISDLIPILLASKEINWGPKPFKFINAWLEKDECKKVIAELPIVLEWSGSPATLEDQRDSKRSRSFGTEQGAVSMVEEDMAMDAELEVVADDTRDSAPKSGDGAPQQVGSNHGKGSYACSYARTRANCYCMEEDVLDPSSVVVLDGDCVISESGDYPPIKFSARVHDQIDHSMRNVIIVRLLGCNIGYGTLLNCLHALWKPKGEIQLIYLENNYFLVRFEDMRDYELVLTRGPWTIFGNYLTVQPWIRSFSTDEKHPSQVIVWVRLSGLPYPNYCKALFRRIAQVVGKVVKVDYNTQARERGKFARLAIMVALNKPLTPFIGIDNFVQKLEYEGLNQICFSCGKYGHSREVCSVNSVSNEEGAVTDSNRVHNSAQLSTKSELYGSWMVDGDRMDAEVVENTQDMDVQLGRPELRVMEAGVSGVVRNKQIVGIEYAAYRKSSHDRRSKITGNVLSMDSSLDVVPLVGGSSLAGIREVNSKGVRTRKAVGVHSPYRVLLSDWVQTTANQIQAEVDSTRGRGDVGSAMAEDGREVVSPRQLPGSDATFFGGVRFKDKGVVVVNCRWEWDDNSATL
ncbi:hypothetical protein GQ457_05G014640 [Hibiscus cannabinus]